MPTKKSKKQKQQELRDQQMKAKAVAKLKQSIAQTKLFGVSTEVPDYSPKYDAPRYADDVTRNIKSNTVQTSIVIGKVELEGEMLERERIAQAEIVRKSKRVAPMYNKGAYQYITDETDTKTIGRKL